ncbi:unnamed protein product, partial [marine sediment metagenome]
SMLESNQKLVLNEVKEPEKQPLRCYLFGINRSRLEQVARQGQQKLEFAADLRQAALFLTTRSYYRRKPQRIRDAEALGMPIYVLKSNDAAQMKRCLDTVYPVSSHSSYVHQLQHLLAKQHNLNFDSRTQRNEGR